MPRRNTTNPGDGRADYDLTNAGPSYRIRAHPAGLRSGVEHATAKVERLPRFTSRSNGVELSMGRHIEACFDRFHAFADDLLLGNNDRADRGIAVPLRLLSQFRATPH